ncbi:hypothetical protein Ark11_1137 [Candidatus Ichthyocystis hellenicum]|uniref:Uncharacterized protein n=1 Tax=Candidatus Ichthyocystis hellenicum TaxID=1561003 RepID=A0A0S4M2N2_9BURK|nr:hypothetical protein Ark11_1137 [Candidatus Ichthyocystis hellenicum]
MVITNTNLVRLKGCVGDCGETYRNIALLENFLISWWSLDL